MKGNVQISKDNKIAIITGGSGLVGSFLLESLLQSTIYDKVVSLGRVDLPIESEKLEHHIVNFDKPLSYKHLMKGDDIFLCMGTTMAKAGSKEAFQKVDFTYNYQNALMASKNGVNQLFLVSSVGASLQSFFFYNKVKGQLELEIGKLDFWSKHFFRPSIILGKRNENRWGEKIAQKIGKGINLVADGLLSRYTPVEAEVIARAMFITAQSFVPGEHVYPSHVLSDIADNVYLYE